MKPVAIQSSLSQLCFMQSPRPHLRLLTCLICLGILLASCALAQTTKLSPQAQGAFDEGLVAARQGDWNLAIRSFLDAQKADPNASQIWFNLGLASSKLPQNEFRAIAWFKAYLLVNPNANNAAAVREQIAQLEVAFEARSRRLVDGLEEISRTGVDKAIGEMAIAGTDTQHPNILTDFSPAELGGMFAAMRLYLGDLSGATKTLVSFGVMPLESQTSLPERIAQCRIQEANAPENLRLAAASSGIKVSCFGAGTSASRRARGDVDDAKNTAGLLIRARDGEVLTVAPFIDSDQAPKKLECDERQLGAFLDAIGRNLEYLQGKDFGSNRYMVFGLIRSLNSLANLLASYRQMRGPYNR